MPLQLPELPVRGDADPSRERAFERAGRPGAAAGAGARTCFSKGVIAEMAPSGMCTDDGSYSSSHSARPEASLRAPGCSHGKRWANDALSSPPAP